MDTRSRILDAATELLETLGAEGMSTRAVCERVGVSAPTLYHHFTDKQGLLDAVAARGFEDYVSTKKATPSSGDPVEDLRRGWNSQVQFGIAPPALYSLMYGSARRERTPAAANAHGVLLGMLREIAVQGRLTADLETAARCIESAVVGVTLQAIRAADVDENACALVREAVIAAVVDESGSPQADIGTVRRTAAGQLAASLSVSQTDALTAAELGVLQQWLHALNTDRSPI